MLILIEILHYSQVYLHYLMVVDHMFTFSIVKKFPLKYRGTSKKFPEIFLVAMVTSQN